MPIPARTSLVEIFYSVHIFHSCSPCLDTLLGLYNQAKLTSYFNECTFCTCNIHLQIIFIVHHGWRWRASGGGHCPNCSNCRDLTKGKPWKVWKNYLNPAFSINICLSQYRSLWTLCRIDFEENRICLSIDETSYNFCLFTLEKIHC